MTRDPLAGAEVEERLARQLTFCLEIDKVKEVFRRNVIADGSRPEGDAEHQWHVAAMAVILAEHAAEPVDLSRVLTMLLLHDVVEIDAGDTFLYDETARAAAAEREALAADRIFGLLPADQESAMRALWEEFEEGKSPDARFARALDRLQPMLLNAAGGGASWRDNGVVAAQVAGNATFIARGAPALAEVARALVARAVADGILLDQPSGEKFS